MALTTPGTVAIVVLSYNGLEDTRKCLRSMTAARRPHAFPILVDNGSTDGTDAAVAAEFPWCRVLRLDRNQGPVGGNNAGMRMALDLGAEWILLLNNDTTVDPALIDRLLEAAQAHPDYSVLGPVIKFMDDPDTVMTDGSLFNSQTLRGFFLPGSVELTQSSPPRVTDVDVVNGCCLMIRSDLVRRIGLFDEKFFMYHDEADLCLRAIGAGSKNGVIDHALVWHKGSATSQGTGKWSVRYMCARNLVYLLKKHRGSRHRGRTWRRTAIAYAFYQYHWYCQLKEDGNDRAATALLEGICDGLAGRDGPYQERRRLLFQPLRITFELLRRRPRRTTAARQAA